MQANSKKRLLISIFQINYCSVHRRRSRHHRNRFTHLYPLFIFGMSLSWRSNHANFHCSPLDATFAAQLCIWWESFTCFQLSRLTLQTCWALIWASFQCQTYHWRRKWACIIPVASDLCIGEDNRFKVESPIRILLSVQMIFRRHIQCLFSCLFSQSRRHSDNGTLRVHFNDECKSIDDQLVCLNIFPSSRTFTLPTHGHSSLSGL